MEAFWITTSLRRKRSCIRARAKTRRGRAEWGKALSTGTLATQASSLQNKHAPWNFSTSLIFTLVSFNWRSNFQSYKSKLVFFTTFIFFPRFQDPKCLKRVSAFCHIQLDQTVTEHFWSRINKCRVIIQKSLSKKKYFKINENISKFPDTPL